jgi:hypothetical protein
VRRSPLPFTHKSEAHSSRFQKLQPYP